MIDKDIVKEYIWAIKYHIDNDCLNLKEVNKIHRESVKYLKEKEKK